MKSQLTLKDLHKLAILQTQQDDDLGIPGKKSAYRKLMRQKVWESLWSEAS